MIQFVNDQIKAEFDNAELNQILKMIVLATAGYIFYKYGEVMYVTSIFRPQNPESTHAYWRAVDADNDVGLSVKEKQEVCDWINKMFCYDLTRLEKVVCLYHKVEGRGGDHWHIQVHPNTTIRRI
jgi:hypothetical protein